VTAATVPGTAFPSTPRLSDTDQDGLSDGDEVNAHATDPLAPDSDGDELLDGEGVFLYGTDPLMADTDGGGRSDGEEVLSPPVRWAQQGAGRLKLHSVPADNEQMVLQSQSGTVGEGAIADWQTYDDDHDPPSDKDSEAVIEFDDGTKVTIEKDRTRVASQTVHVDAETVTLGGEGGPQVARVGDMVQVSEGSSIGLWPIVTGSSIVSAT